MATTTDPFSSITETNFEPKLGARQRWGKIFKYICLAATMTGLLLLLVLVVDVLIDALPRLDLRLFTQQPSFRPANAGFRNAIIGSITMMVAMILVTVPIGVCSAVYLEEYAPKNWLTSFIELNIYNLAAVPSIVYGLLGLGLFVRALYDGRPVMVTAIFTLGLLVLSPIIVVARESIRAVPNSIRLASYGVGATKLQTIWHHVLPSALPGILTGVIISVSRGVGETAPIVVLGIGAVQSDPYVSPLNFGALFTGQWGDAFKDTIWSNNNFFSVLPYQVYEWVGYPKEEFKILASAGIVLLLVLVLGLNSIAIFLRSRVK
ncbi:phosphate ABC transporter membrane protein 2, PhoT family [Thalassoporum mexicanum PCC 7367]|uniref:phosphate ABC transporter permease PstA n=1 Tax=Thalassoporum mexicanum TaxID=3457544 RepID=UPI00029F840C|nr:phosphate ABC transporter permease PstA [Pseudanabaena sp. PCC 7367]AFY69687.1 phosphate ABC transporter membrane protein 2, PhoT family [Pseudanabaena sp. PCC 7367]